MTTHTVFINKSDVFPYTYMFCQKFIKNINTTDTTTKIDLNNNKNNIPLWNRSVYKALSSINYGIYGLLQDKTIKRSRRNNKDIGLSFINFCVYVSNNTIFNTCSHTFLINTNLYCYEFGRSILEWHSMSNNIYNNKFDVPIIYFDQLIIDNISKILLSIIDEEQHLNINEIRVIYIYYIHSDDQKIYTTI
uniref:Uncharacterized protein n=1 Tax=viral metagenome TaxID=1070528 RepID=A0A6C0H8L4_9ZZZZ